MDEACHIAINEVLSKGSGHEDSASPSEPRVEEYGCSSVQIRVAPSHLALPVWPRRVGSSWH